MSFNAVTSSFKVARRRKSPLAETLQVGALAGLAAIGFALIGAYVAMDKRHVVEDTLTLSQIAYALMAVAAGYVAGRDTQGRPSGTRVVLHGALAGFTAGLCVSALMLLMASVNLRGTLVAASPMLIKALSLGAPNASL